MNKPEIWVFFDDISMLSILRKKRGEKKDRECFISNNKE